MKPLQTLVGVYLVFSTCHAFAQTRWIKIDSNETSTAYVDSEVIPVIDTPFLKIIKVWELIDYKTPQSGGNFSYSSELLQSKYNCKEQTVADIYHAFKPQRMGKGDSILPENNPTTFMPIEPDSWLKKVWSYACNK